MAARSPEVDDLSDLGAVPAPTPRGGGKVDNAVDDDLSDLGAIPAQPSAQAKDDDLSDLGAVPVGAPPKPKPAPAPAPDLSRPYPDRVPPAPAAAPPEDPDIAMARRAAQHIKPEDLLPSTQAGYLTQLPEATELPSTVSPVMKPPAPKPNLIQKTLGIDPEAAARRGMERAFQEKSVMSPEDPTAVTGLRRAWREFTHPIYRATEAGPEQFANTASLGLMNALDDALGWDSAAARRPESAIEDVSGKVGDLAGFFGAPLPAASGMVSEAFGRLFVHEAGDRLVASVAKRVAADAAVMGVASGLAHAGDYGREMTLTDAYRAMGQHVASGEEQGAIFGALGEAIPWRTKLGIATRIGVGLTALDVANSQSPMDERSIGQKVYDYTLNALFLGMAGPHAVGEFTRAANEAGQTPYDSFRDVEARVQEARAGGREAEFDRLVGVFQRRGNSEEVSRNKAAQIILQREAGRAKFRPDDEPEVAPEPHSTPPVTDQMPEISVKRKGGQIVITKNESDGTSRTLGTVAADSLRPPTDDYAASLEDVLGHEPKAPEGAPDDYAASLDEIFGEAGPSDIARRGVDLRGTIGAPGWEKDRKLQNDLAAAGAAHLWRGDRTLKRWSGAMVQEFGEGIRPQLETLYPAAQAVLGDLREAAPDRMPTVAQLLKIFHAGGTATPASHNLNPAFWYDQAEPELRRMFGRNAELYAKVLAATSPNTSVKANVTKANKAMIQILSGKVSAERPFAADYDLPAHVDNLNRILRGEPLSGPKVEPFHRALMGDETAIVVDTWMLRAWGLGDNAGPAQIRMIQGAVAAMARQYGMTERQVQAQIWAGIKRKAEGKDTPLPPIDKAIEARIEMLRPYLQTEVIARRSADNVPNPLIERLAGVVAKGKTAGIAPAQMYADFTRRGADPAISLAAIRAHFPDFTGAAHAPAASVPTPQPAAAPAAAPAGQPAPAPAAGQPAPQGPEGLVSAPAGGREGAPRPAVPPAGGGPVQQPQVTAGGQPQPPGQRPGAVPQQRGAVPGGPGATGAGPVVQQPVRPVAQPAAAGPAAHVPAGAGAAPGGDRIRTVHPRGGASSQPDARLEPYLAVLRAGGQHQVDDATRVLQAIDQHGGYGLFNGAGTGKTYILLSVLDAHRRMGSPVYYVSPASVIQVKDGQPSGTLREAAERLGVPVAVWNGVGRPTGSVIHLMTYEKLKKLPPDANAVIAFDEFDFLKNVETGGAESRAAKGADWMASAKGVIGATATPLDKVSHLPYLERIGVYEGKTKWQAMHDLGIVQRQSQRGDLYWAPLNEGETARRIEALFGRLGDAGRLSSRFIDMSGAKVFLKSVAIDKPRADAMIARILEGHGVDSIDSLRGIMKAKVLEDIRRMIEPYKIEPAIALAQEALGQGRQVILYVSRINYSASRTPKKLGRQMITASEGTAKTLKDRLAAAGITDVGELHGNANEERAQTVADFQAGKTSVLIATPESGAQGLNLDDQTGDAPRTTVFLTAPYAASVNVQAVGRTHRLNTKSDPHYYYLDTGVDVADGRIHRIVLAKLRTLGAAVQADVTRKLGEPDIARREAGLASRLREPDSGFTIQPQTGHEPQTGFAVSIYPDRGVELPNHQAATERVLLDFIRRNQDLLFREPLDHHFGGWHDPETGKIFLDVSVVRASEPEAAALAQQHGQKAYYDFANRRSVALGESGGQATDRTEQEPQPGRPGPLGRAGVGEAPVPGGARGVAGAPGEEGPAQEVARRTAETATRAVRDAGPFRRWFGRSRVVDEDGRPQIVFHGTTHDFQQFGPERLNPESAFGSGYYFTSDPEDAGRNYAGAERIPGTENTEILHGPDMQQRITARAEQIENERRGEAPGIETSEEAYAQAIAQATQELAGENPNVMPVYLRMQNPLEIRKNGGTTFSIHSNEDGTREWGNGVKLYDAIHQVGAEMGFDGPKAWADMLGKVEYLDDTPAYQIWNALKQNDEFTYHQDDQGRLVSGEAIRRIFEAAGYDGIILRDADQEYGSMGLEPETAHYIAFRPTQVKSATGNRGTWNLRSGDITRRANAGETDLFQEPGQLSPMFYSNVERFVEAKIPERGSGEQAWNTLKNAQGIKAEELKWLGLEPFLKGQPKVTKAQILDFIRSSNLEPDITMVGGPTPTGQTADVQKLQDRVAQAELDRGRADQALMEYRTTVERFLQDRLERQNEIAKARGKKKRVMKEQELPLDLAPDEATGAGHGQPGSFPINDIPGLRHPGNDWGIRGRRELGPATWKIEIQHQHPYSNDRVVLRNGEIVFRGTGDEAEDYVAEQKALEAGPKPERRWKVNPVVTARRMLEALVETPNPSSEFAGHSAFDLETDRLRQQAEALLSTGAQTPGTIIKVMESHRERFVAAQGRVDAAQKELRQANSDLPEPQYGQYTLPGGDQYFEVGFRKKPSPEVQALENRIQELEQAIDENSRQPLPTELPDGFTVQRVRDDNGSAHDTFDVRDSNGLIMSSGYRTPEESIENYHDNVREHRYEALNKELKATRQALHERTSGPKNVEFTAPHFRGAFQRNLLFHVRGKIRTDSEGRRMLALEELQSDWGIAGRQRGWQGPPLTELPEGYSIKTVEHEGVAGIAASAENDALLGALANRNTDDYPIAVYAVKPDGTFDPEVRIRLYKAVSRTPLENARGEYGPRYSHVIDTRKLSGTTPSVEPWTEYQVMSPDSPEPWRTGFRTHEAALEDAIATLNQLNARGVPEAPFVKGLWQEAAMKWALRYAAEQGYQGVAWTTGKQQADRYNLSKLVDQINYSKDSLGEYRLLGFKDQVKKFDEQVADKDLAGFLGGELAKKIQAGEGSGTLSGLDLELGGEAHKALYDRQIPSFMNKYTKPWGGKVDDITFTHPREAPGASDRLAMHGVLITPEMQKSVLGTGQPLFKKSGDNDQIRLEQMRSQQRMAAEPVPGTPHVVVDGHGGWPQDALREVARHPITKQILESLDKSLQSLKGALNDKYQQARLDGLDIAAWEYTHGYNVIGQHTITVALHKVLAEMLESAEGSPLVMKGTIARSVATDAIDTLIHEIAHEIIPGHGADFLALEKNLRDRMLVERRRTAIKDLQSILTRGKFSGLNFLIEQSERAVEHRQSVAGVVGPGAGSPGGPAIQVKGPESPLRVERGDPSSGSGAESGRDAGTEEAVGGGPAAGSQLREAGRGGPGEGVSAGGPAGRTGSESFDTAPAPGVRGREAGVAPATEAQAAATRATVEYFAAPTAPPPPYTLGGGTVTRPIQPNILARIRKDRVIQEFGAALRALGKGGVVVQGGIQAPGALGQSHRQSGNVRLRHLTDVDTAAHEFGHRLQDALGVRDQDLVPFTGELGALVHFGQVKGPTVPEGWAEFWRLNATDPLNAARLAPGLYRWAEAKLRGEPALDAAWQAFRNQVMELRARAPEDRVAAAIAFPERGPSLPQQVKETLAVGHLRSLWRANMFAYFDATLPFRHVSEAAEAAAGMPLAAARDPYKWSRTMSARIIDTVKGFQHEGVIDWGTRRPVPGSKSYEAIVRAVAARQADFEVYSILSRAKYLAGSKRPDGTPNEIHRSTAAHLMRMADIDVPARDAAIARLEQQHPDFKGVLKDLQGWNDGLLQFMQDSGAYSPEQIDRIRQANELYVPLHRLMDQSGDPHAGAGETVVNVGQAIKRLGGRSERLILPTLQTRMRQALLMVGTAERNYAGRLLFDALQKVPNYGSFADRVPVPVGASTFQLESIRGAIKAAFQKSGQSTAGLDQVDLGQLATIFEPNYRNMPNDHVMIYRDGKPEVWQVHEPVLLKAVAGMGPDDAGRFAQAVGLIGSLLSKVGRAPKKVLQGSVVHAPDFLVAHLTRSAQEQGLQGYLVPPVIGGLRDIATGGRAKERYLSGGGRVFNFEDYTPEGIQNSLNRLKYTTNNPLTPQYWSEGGVARPWRDLMSVLDAAGRVFDEPARVGVARIAYDNPRAIDTTELDRIVEAAYRGRESGLDFNQRGAQTLFNHYLSMIPFAHAVTTGLYRNARNFSQAYQAFRKEGPSAAWRNPDTDPLRRYARGMLIFGGMMLLTALYNTWANQDDPRWQALTDDEKTKNFHIMRTPWSRRFTAEEWQAMGPEEQLQYASPYLKFPKPWWPGFFFATAPAEVLEGVLRHQEVGETMGKLWQSFLTASRIDVLPTWVKIPLELHLNKQQVLDMTNKPRPISSDREMKLEPSARYGPGTPEVAKDLATAFRAAGWSTMSPRDIEYLANSFGYMPGYAMSLAETVGRAYSGKDMPEAPAKRWDEMIAVQRFVQRFPTSHPQAVNDLDAIYRAGTEAAATLKAKIDNQDPDIEQYVQKHRLELMQAVPATAWAHHMSGLYKQIDRIKKQPDMTGEEKRQRIDLLLLDQLDTSQRMLSVMNQLKREARENP